MDLWTVHSRAAVSGRAMEPRTRGGAGAWEIRHTVWRHRWPFFLNEANFGGIVSSKNSEGAQGCIINRYSTCIQLQ